MTGSQNMNERDSRLSIRLALVSTALGLVALVGVAIVVLEFGNEHQQRMPENLVFVSLDAEARLMFDNVTNSMILVDTKSVLWIGNESSRLIVGENPRTKGHKKVPVPFARHSLVCIRLNDEAVKIFKLQPPVTFWRTYRAAPQDGEIGHKEIYELLHRAVGSEIAEEAVKFLREEDYQSVDR
jgi:hypothetical protein